MSIHAQRLERWLGPETIAHLSEKMLGYCGPPIAIGNVPGQVFVDGSGDFIGMLRCGEHASLLDRIETALRRTRRAWRMTARGQFATVNMGFSSLSDLISEATTGGKRQEFAVAKIGVTGVANIANSLWDVGAQPAAGAIATAAPGGSSPDNTTTGGLLQTNPAGGDTLHFVSATMMPTLGNNLLLLHDRFFACSHDMTVDPRTVTGVPSRYQSTASKGCFITMFVTTVLPAATPTYTITYMDQDGNTAETAAAVTIVSGAIARRFPFATSVGNGWFIPLNSGDTGVRKLTNLDLSAAMASGFCDVVLAKPLVWIPQPITNFPVIIDGINSAFNLVAITDSACLALMELTKGATTATSYNGQLTFVAG